MLIITEAPTRLHIIWAIHSFFPPFFKNIYAYSYTHTDRCTLLIAPNLFFKALKLHFSCSFIHKLKSFISLWGYFTLTHTGGRFLLWRDCYSSGILHKSIKKNPRGRGRKPQCHVTCLKFNTGRTAEQPSRQTAASAFRWKPVDEGSNGPNAISPSLQKSIRNPNTDFWLELENTTWRLR